MSRAGGRTGLPRPIPFLRAWAAGAVDAAYKNTPAAIIWHFQKQP